MHLKQSFLPLSTILLITGLYFHSCNCANTSKYLSNTYDIDIYARDTYKTGSFNGPILTIIPKTETINEVGRKRSYCMQKVEKTEFKILNQLAANTTKVYTPSPIYMHSKIITPNTNLLKQPDYFETNYNDTTSYHEQVYMAMKSQQVDSSFKKGKYIFYVEAKGTNGDFYKDSVSIEFN